MVVMLYATSASPRDETRTSYLLQGVQSAWDSVGRARPQGHIQNANALFAAQGGAVGGRASPLGVRESGEGGETPRGAEAPLYMPHKGNNVRIHDLLHLKYCFNRSSVNDIASMSALTTLVKNRSICCTDLSSHCLYESVHVHNVHVCNMHVLPLGGAQCTNAAFQTHQIYLCLLISRPFFFLVQHF